MSTNQLRARLGWHAYKRLTAKQLVAKLALGLLLVGNCMGSFLVIQFARQQFRDAKYSYVGTLGGWEVLGLWLYFELVVCLFALGWEQVRKEANKSDQRKQR